MIIRNNQLIDVTQTCYIMQTMNDKLLIMVYIRHMYVFIEFSHTMYDITCDAINQFHEMIDCCLLR